VIARDAGGIASRVLAIYLTWMALQSLEILLEVMRPGPENTFFSGYSPLTTGSKTALLAFAGIMLWANAGKFWPSDNELRYEPTMGKQTWLSLAMLLMGIYWLLMYADIALIALLKSTLQTKVEWPMYDAGATFQSCLNSIIAIGLILFGGLGLRSRPASQEAKS
jgi:hypothetical protein